MQLSRARPPMTSCLPSQVSPSRKCHRAMFGFCRVVAAFGSISPGGMRRVVSAERYLTADMAEGMRSLYRLGKCGSSVGCEFLIGTGSFIRSRLGRAQGDPVLVVVPSAARQRRVLADFEGIDRVNLPQRDAGGVSSHGVAFF